MNELSNDLNVIVTEILTFKKMAGVAVFEIGKRLDHIKESELVHGQWEQWCEENLSISARQARKYIRVYDRFSNRKSLPVVGLEKLDMLAEFDDEQLETPAELLSGEVKKPIDMTNKEIEQYKRQLKEQQEIVESLKSDATHWQKVAESAKNMPPRIETRTVEVMPEHVKREMQQKENQISNLQISMETMKKRLETTENLQKMYEKDSNEYKELKNQVGFLNREKEDIHRQIESATALSSVAAEIDILLKTKLAPIKYSRVWERMDSEVAVRNFTDILNNVRAWLEDMERYVPKNNRKIVEVIDYDSAG